MSAADRMAVRLPGGEIRSVPRRVGLAMVARSRATHAPPIAAQGRVSTQATPAYVHPLTGVREADLLPPFQAQRGPIEYPNVDPTVSSVRDGEVLAPTELPIEAPPVERPKGNAGREAWAQYAAIHGVEVTDEMGRNEIRDAVVAKLETDRMSQPAFTDDSVEGGRLATPEDEPVTESLVTHADPGTGTA